MVGNRVCDHLEELFLRVGGTDGETVEELNHQTGEPLERTRNTDGRGDFNEDSFGGVNVNLEKAFLVDRGVEKREQTLGWLVATVMLNHKQHIPGE